MKLYAFWNYGGHFPYICHGEVIGMHADGTVRVQGYASMRIIPDLMIPLKEGRELGEKLHTLRAEHTEALAEFNKAWTVQLREMFSGMKTTLDAVEES